MQHLYEHNAAQAPKLLSTLRHETSWYLIVGRGSSSALLSCPVLLIQLQRVHTTSTAVLDACSG